MLRDKYADFTAKHFHEQLRRRQGYSVAVLGPKPADRACHCRCRHVRFVMHPAEQSAAIPESMIEVEQHARVAILDFGARTIRVSAKHEACQQANAILALPDLSQ